jgi:acetylornithine deacetylase/succinyl-diaminopimelate desuccinylase-like protein
MHGSRLLCLFAFTLLAHAAEIPKLDWPAIEKETMEHFQALVRIDTADPPGNEKPAVDYLKTVLEKDGYEVKIFARDPKRPNLVTRLKGNGSKRPLLIMGHTDVVGVQPEKWTYPPFSATRNGGYVYGRGTVDDKDNLVTALMTMLLLKRNNIKLDRDVIFLAEAGEEGSTQYGIQFMVDNHFAEIDAEFCLAEGGSVLRKGGKLNRMLVGTTEKVPRSARLVARGPAGHGSRPLPNNAVLSLSKAVAAVGTWQTPMRLNDTTRAYFERLGTISTPEEKARYNGLTGPKSTEIQQYFFEKEPLHYSMLRTSVTPTIIKAGFRVNVIPSEAEATLDIRATPDENLDQFFDEMRKVINDPNVEIVRSTRVGRPAAPPSGLNNDAFKTIESVAKELYSNIMVLPTMNTGATDMAYLREKGIQSYGIGPLIDEEDGQKGFGAHSDQERILESSLNTFMRFNWEVVTRIAASK